MPDIVAGIGQVKSGSRLDGDASEPEDEITTPVSKRGRGGRGGAPRSSPANRGAGRGSSSAGAGRGTGHKRSISLQALDGNVLTVVGGTGANADKRRRTADEKDAIDVVSILKGLMAGRELGPAHALITARTSTASTKQFFSCFGLWELMI